MIYKTNNTNILKIQTIKLLILFDPQISRHSPKLTLKKPKIVTPLSSPEVMPETVVVQQEVENKV